MLLGRLAVEIFEFELGGRFGGEAGVVVVGIVDDEAASGTHGLVVLPPDVLGVVLAHGVV